MREIRFRAFQDNEMYVQPLPGIYGLKRFLGFIYEDCELMQYVGRTDMEDVEIYDGDALHDVMDDGDSIYLGIVTYDCYMCSFIIMDGDTIELLEDYCSDSLKIIGNIHENPELLEVKL